MDITYVTRSFFLMSLIIICHLNFKNYKAACKLLIYRLFTNRNKLSCVECSVISEESVSISLTIINMHKNNQAKMIWTKI